MNLDILIWSKDRACQLDLLLRSIKWAVSDMSKIKISVVRKCTNQKFADGYLRVYKEHPDVLFMFQKGFEIDTKKVLNSSQSEYFMPLVDDDVFVDKFDMNTSLYKAFLLDSETVCLNLRMSPQINVCFTKGIKTPPPILESYHEGFKWNWKGLPGEWGYPMSVTSHIFRTKEYRELLKHASFHNPPSLESVTMKRKPNNKPFMICYDKAKTIDIPLNSVQKHETKKHMHISQEGLNAQFLFGKSISLEKIIQDCTPFATHQEISVVMK